MEKNKKRENSTENSYRRNQTYHNFVHQNYLDNEQCRHSADSPQYSHRLHKRTDRERKLNSLFHRNHPYSRIFGRNVCHIHKSHLHTLFHHHRISLRILRYWLESKLTGFFSFSGEIGNSVRCDYIIRIREREQ